MLVVVGGTISNEVGRQSQLTTNEEVLEGRLFKTTRQMQAKAQMSMSKVQSPNPETRRRVLVDWPTVSKASFRRVWATARCKEEVC